MDSIVFLSQAEIRQLTGAGTKAGQIANLRHNGIRHTIKANGWPAVLASAVQGGIPEQVEKPTWTPRKAG
ncbi:DUF4224 domain-containing protein [Azotobacter chroococcum]|nr:DUF4224 domain-containing protein [Azotobacter chroococcum]